MAKRRSQLEVARSRFADDMKSLKAFFKRLKSILFKKSSSNFICCFVRRNKEQQKPTLYKKASSVISEEAILRENIKPSIFAPKKPPLLKRNQPKGTKSKPRELKDPLETPKKNESPKAQNQHNFRIPKTPKQADDNLEKEGRREGREDKKNKGKYEAPHKGEGNEKEAPYSYRREKKIPLRPPDDHKRRINRSFSNPNLVQFHKLPKHEKPRRPLLSKKHIEKLGVLGINVDPFTVVTAAMVKEKFHQRVLQCHPDKVSAEEDKSKAQQEFIAVKEAYDFLKKTLPTPEDAKKSLDRI